MAFRACALPPLPPLPARLQVPGCSCSLEEMILELQACGPDRRGAGRLGVALTPFYAPGEDQHVPALVTRCTLSALYISPEATENDHITALFHFLIINSGPPGSGPLKDPDKWHSNRDSGIRGISDRVTQEDY
ncbi:hypothetical protein R6Z07M_019182 [Ovis aries]